MENKVDSMSLMHHLLAMNMARRRRERERRFRRGSDKNADIKNAKGDRAKV